MNIFDGVSTVYTLQSVELHRQKVMRKIKIAHVQDQQFRAVALFALQIPCPVEK